MKIADELRRAIRESKMSRYRLCKLTGIDQAAMSRFMHRKGGFPLEQCEKIAEALGLELKLAVKRP